MGFTPANQITIQVRWTAEPGTQASMGTYEVAAMNLRQPSWWTRPWRLFSVRRPQFQSGIDEMRWAVDELHRRFHSSGLGREPADFAQAVGKISTSFETLSLDRQRHAS